MHQFIAPKRHVDSAIQRLSGHVKLDAAHAALQTSRSCGGLGLSQSEAQRMWPVLRAVLLHFGLALDGDDKECGATTVVLCQLTEEARSLAFRQLSTTAGTPPVRLATINVAPLTLTFFGEVVGALRRHASPGTYVVWKKGCALDLNGCYVAVELDTDVKADTLRKSSMPPVVRAARALSH